MRRGLARDTRYYAAASPARAKAPRSNSNDMGFPVGATITFAAPPPLVVVPSTPTVQYIPTGAYNVFVYGGRYYSFHNGYWFQAGHYNGPWAQIKTEKVPAPEIGVPVAYYRVPPGHAKHDEDGPAAVGHCPPGQAKKGRC